MSDHLSEDQISRGISGLATFEEQQHLRQCPECSAEADRCVETFSFFRSAVTDRAERQVVTAPPIRSDRSRGHWALVAAAVAILTVTVIPICWNPEFPRRATESTAATTNEDVLLMDAVHTHLSRVLPAPMEPVLALLPQWPQEREFSPPLR